MTIPKFRAFSKYNLSIDEVIEISFDEKTVIIQFIDEHDESITTDTLGFDDIKLMQYTGVKDKNGVEIYEGDRISIDSVLGEILITDVYFARGAFRYRHDDNSGSVLDIKSTTKVKGYETITHNIEVIGNIYENRELLDDWDLPKKKI